MKKEKFIAIATQKGGIGKTTVSVLLASYLHYVKGYNVAVIDCDYPQHSVMDIRSREQKLISENEYFRALALNHFKSLGKCAYPIIDCDPTEAVEAARKLIEEEEIKPDIVLFDIPGSVRSSGVLNTLSQMDYIFTPISADRLVIESSIQFVSMFNENLITTGLAKTKKIMLYWTMVDKREKSELYDVFERIFEEMGISIFNTLLPDSKRFRRDLSENRKTIFRSTIFPIDKSLRKGSALPEFADEICEIINIQ